MWWTFINSKTRFSVNELANGIVRRDGKVEFLIAFSNWLETWSQSASFILFFIYLFLFLLTINLKLIIVHVEIKIVNKQAATKRSTLLHAQHGRRTFEQSDVMLIRKGKRKEVN